MYIVEAIVDRQVKVSNGRRSVQYKVYPESDNSWEAESNLIRASAVEKMIEDYDATHSVHRRAPVHFRRGKCNTADTADTVTQVLWKTLGCVLRPISLKTF